MLAFLRITDLLAMLGTQCMTFNTPAKADERLIANWQKYADRFITSDGRVVDNANHNVSHSEGQGYAMLLAERLDDRNIPIRFARQRAQMLKRRKDP
jgi:endoglucanase